MTGVAGALVLAGCGGGTDSPGATPGNTETYGPGERQYGEWTLPDGDGRVPVVVLLHGGFWRPDFGPYLERRVALAAARRGFAVWNVDYRASDVDYPATFLDAASAVDHLPSSRFAERLDLGRVAVVGHSAGGHLALWLAGRPALSPSAPGAATSDSVRLRLAVGQAPVADLVAGFRDGLGGGAVQALMDATPGADARRYREGSPQTLLPVAGTRVLLVHGDADEVVPVGQSRAYAVAAGPAADLQVLPGIGHFEHLDPGSAALDPVWDALDRM